MISTSPAEETGRGARHAAVRHRPRRAAEELPRVQALPAAGAGLLRRQGRTPIPPIVRTLYEAGRELRRGLDARVQTWSTRTSRRCRPSERQDCIWDKIIYANPIKPIETLAKLDQYKPLVTYDNFEEIEKIKQHAPQAGLALRLKVPNTGAMVELSSKFGASPGEAVDLILEADRRGLVGRGPQLPRRQPDDQLRELRPGPEHHRGHLQGSPVPRLHQDEPARHRRRLPRALRREGPARSASWRRIINSEFKRLFPKDIEILAEPGRFLVATAGTPSRR